MRTNQSGVLRVSKLFTRPTLANALCRELRRLGFAARVIKQPWFVAESYCQPRLYFVEATKKGY